MLSRTKIVVIEHYFQHKTELDTTNLCKNKDSNVGKFANNSVIKLPECSNRILLLLWQLFSLVFVHDH